MPNRKVPQDPTLPQGFNATFRERFESYVTKTETCLIWNGLKMDDRLQYGIIFKGYKSGVVLAHRAAWMLDRGYEPIGELYHYCPYSTADCVTPAHWILPNDPLPAECTNQLIGWGMRPSFIDPGFLIANGFSPCAPWRWAMKVNRTESCWLWKSCKDPLNRGNFSMNGDRKSGQIGPSVAAWVFYNGPVPDGKWVLHDCPNGDLGSCVNPRHLWLGDCAENMEDCARKRRFNSKLTWEEAEEIRKEWPAKTTRQIGAERGIGKSTVWMIVRGDGWRHKPYDIVDH